MDKVTQVKQVISAAEWVERIRECRNSGATVTEWCRQNGINPQTYYYHLRMVRDYWAGTILRKKASESWLFRQTERLCPV